MRTIGLGAVLAVTLASGAAATGTRLRAQSASKILDGVYSDTQAERGKIAFRADCASCHGRDLSGGSAPALKGETFLKRWEFKGLNTLVAKVFDTMPNGYATNVQESVKVDMVSYILQNNGYPAGKEELTDDLDALQEMSILVKGGALQETGEVANFSLVQTVGCLTEGPKNTWMLTNMGHPVHTTSPAVSNATRAKALAEAPLGTGTFQLLNAVRLKPETLKGQKVEAKGFIYRNGADNQIAVSALQSLASSCGR